MGQLITTGGYGETSTGTYADIDWSQSKYNLIFSINSAAINFKIRTHNINFGIQNTNLNFDINIFSRIFKIRTHNINFVSKRCP